MPAPSSREGPQHGLVGIRLHGVADQRRQSGERRAKTLVMARQRRASNSNRTACRPRGDRRAGRRLRRGARRRDSRNGAWRFGLQNLSRMNGSRGGTILSRRTGYAVDGLPAPIWRSVSPLVPDAARPAAVRARPCGRNRRAPARRGAMQARDTASADERGAIMGRLRMRPGDHTRRLRGESAKPEAITAMRLAPWRCASARRACVRTLSGAVPP